MTKITDTGSQTTMRVCRSFRTTDGAALLHVTADRKIWLDCTNGGPGNMCHVGTLLTHDAMTRANVRRAANQ